MEKWGFCMIRVYSEHIGKEVKSWRKRMDHIRWKSWPSRRNRTKQMRHRQRQIPVVITPWEWEPVHSRKRPSNACVQSNIIQ